MGAFALRSGLVPSLRARAATSSIAFSARLRSHALMPQPDARVRFFDLLRASIADGSLEKLTLGKYRGADASLKNIFVRPVMLRDGPRLSFVYRHATRDVTKNYPAREAVALVEKLVGADFLDAHLFADAQNAQLECTPEGKARLRILGRAKPPAEPFNVSAHPEGSPCQTHDRTRQHAIPATAPWLRALGVTNDRAQVREGKAAKFRQINKFAELLSHLAAEAQLIEEPWLLPLDKTKAAGTAASTLLRIADMGCGKGYLTFATAALFGEHARVLGIEARADLVELCNRVAREQGFANLIFRQGTIANAALDDSGGDALDVLIALHACDTATDDAIARGVAAGARLIVVSPCCQKELRSRLVAPPALAPALRHGIFQERQAEFVTDALRALLLECEGYRTKVFEFVSTEHTAKNLMIAAIKTREAQGAGVAALEKVRELARFYGIHRQTLASHLNINLGP